MGRIHPKKQPELAVRATALVAGAPMLAMLGEGELEMDEPPHVHRCGFVPDASRYFAAFDALLMTAAPVEAFGMTALEAMAAGVPVVCSRAPGPGFVLGDLGCYYERDEPQDVARAVQDALSADVSLPSRLRVSAEFSVPALAERLAGLIETLGEPHG